MQRRRILFSLRHLRRLRVERGFPAEPVAAVHVCQDGLLYKDAFIPYDEVSAVEAPAELTLRDPALAGAEARVPLEPGEGCLVLRRGGSRDVVFLLRDAPALRRRVAEAWERHRADLPLGWRRVRTARFSVPCPDAWQKEESRHPDLQLRLFAPKEGLLLNVLVYKPDGGLAPAGVLDQLVAKKDGSRLLSRGSVRVGPFSGERAVLREAGGGLPVVSHTTLLRVEDRLVELQFLVAASRWRRSLPVVERVAGGFRWDDPA